jgi:hypothetical protein
MADRAARQAAAGARQPAVSGGVRIPVSKITAPVPSWLGQRLSLAESRAYAGGIQAALAASRPRRRRELAGGGGDARARVTAGDARNATRAAQAAVRHRAQLDLAELRHDPERFRARRRLLAPTLRRD